MAVSNITVDISSHDYGNKLLGTTTDFVFTYTNVSSPSRTVHVTLTGPSAPYTIVAGGSTFTLTNNGDSNAITVRFSPVALGTFADSITTSNPDSFNNADPVSLTGVGYSNTYSLPDILNMACGTVKVTLIMPTSVGPITIPTKNTFLDIAGISEAAQEQLSQSSISLATVRVIDDASVYTEGFWWMASQYALSLKFYLVEGGSDTFLFYGSIQSQQTKWTEYYVGSLGYAREGELNLISAEGILFSTATSDWVTEVLARSTINPWPNAITYRGYIRITDLFECMLTASGLNSWSGSNADISVILDASNPDFQYYITTTVYTVSDLAIQTSYWNSAVAATYTLTDYWDNTNANGHALAVKHATLQDAISALLFNFQLTMRMSYDTATGRHKIQLVQLGRAFASPTTASTNPIKSEIVWSTNLTGDAVRVQQEDAAAYYWISKKYNPSGTEDTTAAPGYVQFDIDKPILFSWIFSAVFVNPYDLARMLSIVYSPFGTEILQAMDDIKVWRYDTGAYYDLVTMDAYAMMHAICKYIYFRFPIVSKRQVNRSYASIATLGGSHLNAVIMQRIAINLGDGSSDYYANKVTKNVSANTLDVEWIQE